VASSASFSSRPLGKVFASHHERQECTVPKNNKLKEVGNKKSEVKNHYTIQKTRWTIQ
jgi:hypothetical protein